MSKLLLLGGSGAVGSQVLAAALSSPQILTVHALGRTPPPATHTKLLSGSIDFNALVLDDPAAVRKVRELDVEFVVIALGTTRANAGSMEKFVKIDKEYVIAAAKAARVEGKKQRLVYCSVSRPFSRGTWWRGLGAAFEIGNLRLALLIGMVPSYSLPRRARRPSSRTSNRRVLPKKPLQTWATKRR